MWLSYRTQVSADEFLVRMVGTRFLFVHSGRLPNGHKVVSFLIEQGNS